MLFEKKIKNVGEDYYRDFVNSALARWYLGPTKRPETKFPLQCILGAALLILESALFFEPAFIK